MAETNAIRAGRAYVEIFADNSLLIKGLKQAAGVLRNFGTALSSTGLKMMGMGAAITLPLLKAAQSAGHMGHELSDMAIRTGASVESLSALSYAANQTGTSMESVEKGFKFMHKNLFEAKGASKEATEKFKQLGITVADLKNSTPEQTFALLAEKIGGLKDPTERAGMALKLFGRSGTELLPLFDLGAAGFAKMTAEAKRLGLIMSTEDAQAAATFYEEGKKLVDVLRMGMFRVGSALIPVLRGVAEWVVNVAVKMTEWVKQNKELIVQILFFGTAILAGGAALFAFGKILTVVGGLIGGFLGGIKLINSAIAFLISPFGLLTAAIVAAGYAFFKFTSYGAQALSWLGDRFSELSADASESFNAISNALAKGDIGQAAAVAWGFVKVEFLRAKIALMEIWYSFRNTFLEYWNGIGHAVVVTWNYAVYGIRIAWAETVAALKTIWSSFKMWYGDTVDWMAGVFLELWVKWKEMTDKGFDAKAARSEFSKTFAQDKTSRQYTAASELIAADTQLRQSEADAKKRFDDALAAEAKAYANSMMANNDESARALAQAEADLKSAQEAWKSAMSAANTPGAKSPPIPPKLDDSLADASKSVIRGTFNPNAISQLSGNSTIEKIEKNTRDTTAAINTLIRHNENMRNVIGMFFGD